MNKSKKSTSAQVKASVKYDKKNTKIIPVKLNLNTDRDIIDFLESVDNKQGFIKQLIRGELYRQIKE